MSFSHHRIIRPPGGSNRNSMVRALLWFAVCASIPLAFLLFQIIVNPSRGLLDDQLKRIEATIRENMETLEKLEYHERRLSAAAGNAYLIGDYHLTSASMALDRGTTVGAPAVDADGASRPVDFEGVGSDVFCDATVVIDFCIVPDTPKQTIADPRSAA